MMPLDGYPHPIPGQLQQPDNFWALSPYPALGWNNVPQPIAPEMQQPEQGVQDGWVPGMIKSMPLQQ